MNARRLATSICAATCALASPVMAVAPQSFIKASNTGSDDRFGSAVAISGDTMVVGAPGEASDATGVNGNAYSDFAFNSGAAYVFVRDGGSWVQQAYLKASNTGAADGFGWSVAISGDTIVVGSYQEDSEATGINGSQTGNGAAGSGAAYVFVRNGSSWLQQAYLKASNTGAGDLFGASVAVSGDTVVVGANREASNVAGVNGSQGNNSAAASGAAYVFARSGAAWTQQAYLKASDTAPGAEFGSAVAASGGTVVVGAPLAAGSNGAAYVFTRTGSLWTQQFRLQPSIATSDARFGYSVAVSGETVVAGAPGEASHATGINGDAYSLSSPGSGAAYVFRRAGTAWSHLAYLKASNTGAQDAFGTAVSLDGGRLVIGAPGEDSNGTGVNGNQASNAAGSAGAAYLFMREGGQWSQISYFKASNTEAGDQFGKTVAVSGVSAVAGAARESAASSGVGGSQAGNGALWSGAAYTFDLPEMGPPEIALRLPAGGDLLDGSAGVAWGTAVTSSPMVQTIWIRNAGGLPLDLGSPLIGGANPLQFTADPSALPASLGEGDEAPLRVIFTSSGTGSYQATLQVLSNDPDESPFDIALSASSTTALGLYNSWTSGNGLGGGDAGLDATPFLDGVENVLKYGFNLNGSSVDVRMLVPGTGSVGLPVFHFVGRGSTAVFRAEYLRRKGAGLSYTPKVSTTLAAGSFTTMTGTSSVTDLGGNWERVVIDQPRDPATSPKVFGVVEVTLP